MNPNRFTARLRALDRRTDREPIRAEIPDQSLDGLTATIRLYDPVDSYGEDWGVSAKEFAAALDAIPANVEEIRLHLNSPGGDVFDGIAIVNALRSHRARVVAVVDGIAASAASFIACAADETIMAPNSELMIHDAWGLCVGNATEMKSMAEMLDHISDNIASIYAEKAGTDVALWRDAMSTETWYSADEAVEAGLADRVEKAKKADPVGKNRHDLSIFTYAGRDAAPTPAPVVGDAGPEVVILEADTTVISLAVPQEAKAKADADQQRRERSLRLLVASTPGAPDLADQAS